MSSDILRRAGRESETLRAGRKRMERKRQVTDQPTRDRRALVDGDSESDPATLTGGSTAVRGRQTWFPDLEDWDTFNPRRCGDHNVPGRCACRDNSADWEMEKSNVPALHSDPGPATDARSSNKHDSKPRIPGDRTRRNGKNESGVPERKTRGQGTASRARVLLGRDSKANRRVDDRPDDDSSGRRESGPNGQDSKSETSCLVVRIWCLVFRCRN